MDPFSWRLTAYLHFDMAQELTGRLLVNRPLWDLEMTPFEPQEDSNINTCVSLIVIAQAPEKLHEDIAYFQETLKQITRRRPRLAKLHFTWLSDPPLPLSQPIPQLGPWNISSDPEKLLQGRYLIVPQDIYLNARSKIVAALALGAQTDYLSPPPGAPETKESSILIAEEGPALLTAAALQEGLGRVTLIAAEEQTHEAAREAADKLGQSQRLKIIRAPFNAVIKDSDPFEETFDLMVFALSPFAVARNLKYLPAFLTKNQGRLIIAGLPAGIQTAWVLKNSFKAGFFLHSSATSDGFSVVNLSQKPPRPEPVWDWTPGAWLNELTEDEKSILEEAEAADKKSRRLPDYAEIS
jgi:hypothetical protein